MATRSSNKAPWDQPTPKDQDGASHTHLTPQQKASAKRSAKAAGRPYPNLVDNMKVSRAAKKPKKA